VPHSHLLRVAPALVARTHPYWSSTYDLPNHSFYVLHTVETSSQTFERRKKEHSAGFDPGNLVFIVLNSLRKHTRCVDQSSSEN